MTRRLRRWIFGAAVVAAVTAAALGSRGFRVEIKNATGLPITGVELTSPGGTIVIPRIDPGSTIERTAGCAFDGLTDRRTGVPIGLTFTHDGHRSTPCTLRFEPPWLGTGWLSFSVIQARRRGPVQVVGLTTGRHEMALSRLLENTFVRGIGPKQYSTFRYMGVWQTVIGRHDWRSWLRDRAGDVPVAAALVFSARPVERPALLCDMASCVVDGIRNEYARDRPLPDSLRRLPFLDFDAALNHTRTVLWQVPYGP